MILAGRVRVNGEIVRQLGTKADPRADRITVDGRTVVTDSEPIYILLNKPVGVVSTVSDPEGRPTVLELVRRIRTRVFPVGRLDYHTSGLLLLTNDGELALRLMHPRYGVTKKYHVKVKGKPGVEAISKLSRGVRLEEGRTAPAEVRVLRRSDEKTWLEIVLGEGRKREVRRMCEAVGHPVEKLQRTELGPLSLGKLAVGDFRPLKSREIDRLRYAVGLA